MLLIVPLLYPKLFPYFTQNSNHLPVIFPSYTEWWETHDESLPSLEKMTDIWKLASTENLTSAQEEFITWYWKRWLPVIADTLYWGEPTRYHKLPVDTCKIARKDENEEEVLEDKVLVTVTSEAFGWLVYANCREKWLRTFEYKKQHGKNAEIPKTGDAAIPFKAKFTYSKLGQVKCMEVGPMKVTAILSNTRLKLRLPQNGQGC